MLYMLLIFQLQVPMGLGHSGFISLVMNNSQAPPTPKSVTLEAGRYMSMRGTCIYMVADILAAKPRPCF